MRGASECRGEAAQGKVTPIWAGRIFRSGSCEPCCRVRLRCAAAHLKHKILSSFCSCSYSIFSCKVQWFIQLHTSALLNTTFMFLNYTIHLFRLNEPEILTVLTNKKVLCCPAIWRRRKKESARGQTYCKEAWIYVQFLWLFIWRVM